MKHTKLLAVLAATALACGGGTATSHNNAGTGTSTLLVTGAIEASMNNGAPVTNFTVTLRDGLGNRVPAATVTISNSGLPNGSVSLVEAQAGSGRYLNSIAQFPGGDFGLSVTRNTDNVQGVVVGGLPTQAHTQSPPRTTRLTPISSSSSPASTRWTSQAAWRARACGLRSPPQ